MNVARGLRLAVCLLALTAPAAQAQRVLPAAERIARAERWAEQREGRVSFAVVDSRGRLHASHGTRPYPAASTTKAMLLVAYLRRTGSAPVPPPVRPILARMIRRSGNRAASAVHAIVGDAGLASVAAAARMRRFAPDGTWSNVLVTAADQARLFARIDRLVPRRHRPYARRLLETIVPRQSWGVPKALRRDGFRVLFKGGWRRRLVHQAALIERDGGRIALAVLTDGNPTHVYGRGTIEGIARRLLATVAPAST